MAYVRKGLSGHALMRTLHELDALTAGAESPPACRAVG